MLSIYLCDECDTLAQVTLEDNGLVAVKPCKCVEESESND